MNPSQRSDRSSVGASLNSPSVDGRSGANAGDPASILAAALAQRKGKVGAHSGNILIFIFIAKLV